MGPTITIFHFPTVVFLTSPFLFPPLMFSHSTEFVHLPRSPFSFPKSFFSLKNWCCWIAPIRFLWWFAALRFVFLTWSHPRSWFWHMLTMDGGLFVSWYASSAPRLVKGGGGGGGVWAVALVVDFIFRRPATLLHLAWVWGCLPLVPVIIKSFSSIWYYLIIDIFNGEIIICIISFLLYL